MKAFLVAALAATAFAIPAHAAITVATYASPGSPASDPGFATLGQTLYEDFEGGALAEGVLSGSYSIAAAPGIPNVTAPPAGTPDGSHYLTVPGADGGMGTASFLLDNAYLSVSFYWGSIDSYNMLEVLGLGGTVLATFTGSSLPAPILPNGDQTGNSSNIRVNFISDGAGITGFRYTSNGYAFETDTYAVGSVVPEASTWTMMIFGFGLIGVSARRRRRRVVLA